jgi:hypothetical protein
MGTTTLLLLEGLLEIDVHSQDALERSVAPVPLYNSCCCFHAALEKQLNTTARELRIKYENSNLFSRSNINIHT